MNTSKSSLAALLGSLALASCYQPDVVMRTTIGDGLFSGCTRSVTYSNVMSREMRDSLWGNGPTGWSEPLPECLDIDYFVMSETVIGADDTVTTTFTARFRNASDMSKRVPLQLNGIRFASDARLRKRFRWFYTDYVFTETFPCLGNCFSISDTLFASHDEVLYWFTGQPNLVEGMSGAEASQRLSEIEPAITHWLNDNLTRVGFDFIVAHYDSIPAAPVSKERFVELHDSLCHYLLEGSHEFFSVDFRDRFRAFFHSDAFDTFFDPESPLGTELAAEYNIQLNILWFNVPYVLSMPGKVLDTGSGALQSDGSILYRFTGERLIPTSYTISATSRVVNLWACILTALLCLAALIGSLHRKKRNLS